MARLLLFNKPYGVISQFRPAQSAPTLADYLNIPEFYPAGRLDKDSEGLLLLTNNGRLQARITEPRYKLAKTYWVQVEGDIDAEALHLLRRGLDLKDGKTRPCKAVELSAAPLSTRDPPVRSRARIPTSWISLTITEGRNRQVRRMTAASGFRTLRRFRRQSGPWSIGDLQPGEQQIRIVNLPR